MLLEELVRRQRQRRHRFPFLELLLVLSLLLVRSDAYRTGDPVDTDVRYGQGQQKHDVLRSQTPLFGKDTSAEFAFQERKGTFTMTFEDGLWGLPAIPMLDTSTTNSLSSWVITFVYSKAGSASVGGEGEIHTVTYGSPEYKTSNNQDEPIITFTVQYRWIEEPEVRVNAGQTVMVLVVVLASLYIICSSLDEGESSDGSTSFNKNGSVSGSSVPKYE